jgi:hypothetical protein
MAEFRTISAGKSIKQVFKKEDIPKLFDKAVNDIFTLSGGTIYTFQIRKLLNEKEQKLLRKFDLRYFDKFIDNIDNSYKNVLQNILRERHENHIKIFRDIILSLSKDFKINHIKMKLFKNSIELEIKTSSVPNRYIEVQFREPNWNILRTNIRGVERYKDRTYKYENLPYNEYPKDYFTKKGLSSRFKIKFLPIRDKFFESIKYTTPKRIEKYDREHQQNILRAEHDEIKKLEEKWYKEFLEKYKSYPKTVTFTSAINPYKFEENTVVLVPHFGDYNEKNGTWEDILYKIYENGKENDLYAKGTWGKRNSLNYILNEYLETTYYSWRENEKN